MEQEILEYIQPLISLGKEVFATKDDIDTLLYVMLGGFLTLFATLFGVIFTVLHARRDESRSAPSPAKTAAGSRRRSVAAPPLKGSA